MSRSVTAVPPRRRAGGALPSRQTFGAASEVAAAGGLAAAALGPAQLAALVRVAGRELAWGLAACSREVRRWRARAQAIPDPSLRVDALEGLTRKRTHLDGAALFAALPPRRSPELLRALVAFQTILEYLDGVNERAAHAGGRNGLQLHLALREALIPGSAPVDYYRHNPAREDGGYLRELVSSCQRACSALPSYAAVRGPLLDSARSLDVLALNHEPDRRRRDALLQRWVARERPARLTERWHELTGEATGSLAIHGLLALAARERVEQRGVELALAVYPRMGALATMLDSYVDQARDAERGTHSYLAHYAPEETIAALAALVGECLASAPGLPGGQRNSVLVASMIAMYLSGDGARIFDADAHGDADAHSDADAHGATLAGTRALTRVGGALTRLLIPVLRAWRLAYGLASA
ncbi:MAG: DUF2600 family protein [Solirubrobacteraceae bacterium]